MMLLALALAAAPAAESPRAFVERIYAGYRTSGFSPFARPERWFAPRLLAAIKEDSRLAHGEVGYLDGDSSVRAPPDSRRGLSGCGRKARPRRASA